MSGTRGILNPQDIGRRFTLARRQPPADLAPFVEWFWLVRWDLEGGAPYEAETLPFPAVHLVVEAGQSAVRGVSTRRFVRRLAGRGSVVGTRFLPGGFLPFAGGADMASLRERAVPLGEMFGAAGAALERRVLATDDDEARCALVAAFLRTRAPRPDPAAVDATRAVSLAMCDAGVRRVEDLAGRLGATPRALQRLFRRAVGASPKWVIRRFRIQEACERAASGGRVDWAELALSLGYFDQSHFIKDFRSQVGQSPAQYAAGCAKVTPSSSSRPEASGR